MAASNGFMYHLSMAACEWFLIFLMFLDAALAFILKKFAHHCQLQSPCIFCLRLDHVFGNEEPGSYLSLFCHKHRSVISCLVSCELHGKLADVGGLCDDCFMAVMIQNQSNGGFYGKEGIIGMKGYEYQKPFLNRNRVCAPSSTETCSCCKKQWKGRPIARSHRLILPGSARLGIHEVNMKPPLPENVCGNRYCHRDRFKKVRDRVSVSSSPCHVDNSMGMDVDVSMAALSDSGFADDRFYSGSESEVSLYEDDDANSNVAVVSEEMASEDDSHVMDGHTNESVISPLSFTSYGSIGHEVEESNLEEPQSPAVPPLVPQDINNTSDQRELSSNNLKEDSPPEVIEETQSLPSRDPIHDMHSKSDGINDLEGSTSSDKSDVYESPGGASSVSEIEGESIVDRLNRQVEHDREWLKILSAELEEERNAASIAADEAMAMITRLQEEKAALHMEALQYLRMMDEQAEYDMEALDKANDVIAEKDKEIQDLEAELEYFRSRYDDELMMGDSLVETENFGGDCMGNGKTDVKSYSDLKFSNASEPRPKPVEANPSIVGLEDEKKNILQSLSELEKKIHQYSSEHTFIGKSNGNIHDGGTQSDQSTDENCLSTHKDSSTSNGSKKIFSANGHEVDANSVENEISDLHERLEALEADRSFLEHACNMLQGNGGLEFIQEVAHHLQELRRTRFDRRCQSVG